MHKMIIAFALFGALVGVTPYVDETVHAATCVGANPCHACKNCRYCQQCAQDDLTCGTCKKH
jgi:hypothetical protein